MKKESLIKLVLNTQEVLDEMEFLVVGIEYRLLLFRNLEKKIKKIFIKNKIYLFLLKMFDFVYFFCYYYKIKKRL